MGAAQTTMKEDTKRGSFLTASTTGASLWIRSEKHLDAARSSRTSVQCSSVRRKNSSETPPDHHSRMKHCDPDIPRNSNNTDTTTRSALGKPAHDYDTSEDGDGHRTPVAETNRVPTRDFVTLAMTEQRGQRFSDSESDGEDWESDGDDSESDGVDWESDVHESKSDGGDSESDGDESESDSADCESESDDRESESDDGERGEEADGSSASGDEEGGNSGGTSGGSTSDEEDGEVDIPCIRLWMTPCSQTVDGDSDGSWSSFSWSSSGRSSVSGRISDCGSSGHKLSFSSLRSHEMRRWKSRRASLSAKNRRRSSQPKRVEASVLPGDEALLSEGELVEKQTMTELREQLHAITLELSRERFHIEVVKQEEAQTRPQLISKYDAEVEKLEKNVPDQEIFREKMLDNLAQCEDDEMESVGRGVGQAKSDDASAELEGLRRSNVHLVAELQDLRQKYQAQSVTLRQEREALAAARKALEAQ